MSRLNGIVKFIMINVNIFLSFIGFALFGIAMYLWCSDWGNLDKGFFVGSGVLVALLGISLFFLGCIGCLGIDHQGRIKKAFANSCIGKWYLGMVTCFRKPFSLLPSQADFTTSLLNM